MHGTGNKLLSYGPPDIWTRHLPVHLLKPVKPIAPVNQVSPVKLVAPVKPIAHIPLHIIAGVQNIRTASAYGQSYSVHQIHTVAFQNTRSHQYVMFVHFNAEIRAYETYL